MNTPNVKGEPLQHDIDALVEFGYLLGRVAKIKRIGNRSLGTVPNGTVAP